MRWQNLFLRTALVLLSLALCHGDRGLWAQSESSSEKLPTTPLEKSLLELQKQIRELQGAIQELHAVSAQYRAETLALKKELEDTRNQVAVLSPRGGEPTHVTGSTGSQELAASKSTEERLGKIEEDQGLLGERINEQYQTKVESASKYRVRLSGIVLLNLFSNRGSVDNIDVPNVAVSRNGLDSGGSFGGTLRQSELGLEVFGPDFAGAKTRADVQFDFSGGFPSNFNGVTEGIVRLRTGKLRLDWKATSIVAGQDGLFFSPLSPSSFASLSIPALSYSGNLWSWTPQVRVEHRIGLSHTSDILIQGGVLDPLTGEFPVSEYFRQPQAGERSRQPGLAVRVAWTDKGPKGPLTIGIGGYYSRQNWGFGRNVDAWAATSDWSFPLNRWLRISGEFYRGRAVGGLGGGIGRSVVADGLLSNPATSILGLNSLGGWTQLKIKPVEKKIEFNVAFGQENPFARDLRRLVAISSSDPTLSRNRSSFANVIYRPRSDLILSVEYRHMRTFAVRGDSQTADHINTMMGFTF